MTYQMLAHNYDWSAGTLYHDRNEDTLVAFVRGRESNAAGLKAGCCSLHLQ